MSTPRVLVCGGRDYQNWRHVRVVLDLLCEEKGWCSEKDEYGNFLPQVHIIAGGAKGADTFAADWAVVNWCGFTEFKADWKAHGKAAGAIRNQQMLDEGSPDIVVAFPGGRGTADMVRRAKANGLEVLEIHV